MCGIAGLLTDRQTKHLPLIQSAIESMKHRGPDDSGIESFSIDNQCLTLGHTRLAIIDLTKNGHQPMTSADSRYTVTFNGEIFNYIEIREELKVLGYAFHTNSDTEVLLNAWAEWGTSALEKFTGMFAFAIYDHKAKTLHLVRDNFGIKPLFYYHRANKPKTLAFASEIQVILSLIDRRPELNYQRAYSYLLCGLYENNVDTFFKDIYHVPSGSYLCFDLQLNAPPKLVQWWHPDIQQTCQLNFSEAAEKLRDLFLDSIKLHMRSDVKIGVTLSGGIDSAAISCAMRHIEPELPIHTFTFASTQRSNNEEKWADLINQHIKAIPHKISLNDKNIFDDLTPLIVAQGEPFNSTSVYAQNQIFAAAKKEGVIVAIEGQGADEILAGYDGYPSARVRSMLNQRELALAIKFLLGWSKTPGHSMRQALQKLIRSSISPKLLRPIIIQRDKKLNPWVDTTWFENNQSIDTDSIYDSPVTFDKQHPDRILISTLRNAVMRLGLPALLRHGDRNSMRWSIESRVPFLNHKIVEYLFSLPESYLVGNNGETKHIFRQAMRSIVPDEVLFRKDKIGFETPERSWLNFQTFRYEELMPIVNSIPFLQNSTNALKTPTTSTRSLWRLINFCKWFELFQPQL